MLILHLQRIVFNLDTLMNEKINSRVEFPMELQLKRYLVDERDAHYRLAGVVVHYGTAEFGHYFSYIDSERDGPTSSGLRWLEFNDHKVKEFKLANLESECFGGASSSTADTEDFGWWKARTENSQNAYILVYEKLDKSPLKVECATAEEMAHLRDHFGLQFLAQHERGDGKSEAELDFYGLPRYVPPALAAAVDAENQQFQLERSLFDPEFFAFLAEVCQCFELPAPDWRTPYYA